MPTNDHDETSVTMPRPKAECSAAGDIVSTNAEGLSPFRRRAERGGPHDAADRRRAAVLHPGHKELPPTRCGRAV